MNQPDSTLSLQRSPPPAVISPIVGGTIWGLVSAVAYTAANICLRAVSNCDPTWVSCVKSFPTVVLVGPWLMVLVCQGSRILPPLRTLLAIVLAGAFGHLAGNVVFQWSLGVIRIALTVPITLGTIIVTGAIMGRVFLQEAVTARSSVAMLVLITAICFLSLGAGDAHRSVASEKVSVSDSASFLLLAAGVAGAAISGFAYSVLGVVIRYAVTGKSPLTTTMVIVAIIGTIGLGALSWLNIGIEGILDTGSSDLSIMLLAGIFNALAFLALAKALQLTTVAFVNALNASQVAMAAAAGVVLFREALTIAMMIGVGMTVVGLLLMKRPRPRKPAGNPNPAAGKGEQPFEAKGDS